MEKSLEIFEDEVEIRLDRMDQESKLAHRRINVHDRIVSKVIDQDFDSRAVAESGVYPKVEKHD